MAGLEFKLNKLDNSDTSIVTLYRVKDGKRQRAALAWLDYSEGEVYEPTFEVTNNWVRDHMIEVIRDAGFLGPKKKEESIEYLKGMLEAREAHLKDLMRLLQK